MDGDFNCSRWRGSDALLNQRVCKITIKGAYYEDKFLELILQPYLSEINRKTSSLTVKHLSSKSIADIPLPLPPLNEQHRIVSRIEELFTRLDAGVEPLEKVKVQLKRYRQAVLKYAFEGKLTEKWREEHKVQIEQAYTLLERIKEERKKYVKEENEQFQPLDTKDLLHLPEGWIWTRIGEISRIISGQTPKGINRCGREGNVPYYKVNDMNKIGNERFMFDSEIFLNQNDIKRLKIHIQERGTIIFPKRGGAIATNKIRILAKPSAYDLNIMGIQPFIIPYDFLYYWFSKIDLIKLSDGSNIPQINHKNIKPLIFPLPPLSEQYSILKEIDLKLSIANKIERNVGQEIFRAQQLRQSILKRAFEGNLVTQDPSDEPVEKLLIRIKAEKGKPMNEERAKKDIRGKEVSKQMEMSSFVK
jgi:type I restriction enzyme S subunit